MEMSVVALAAPPAPPAGGAGGAAGGRGGGSGRRRKSNNPNLKGGEQRKRTCVDEHAENRNLDILAPFGNSVFHTFMSKKREVRGYQQILQEITQKSSGRTMERSCSWTCGLGVLGVPGPAPLAWPPAPFGHVLAPPPPSCFLSMWHGMATYFWK